jgi:hypothetical protein
MLASTDLADALYRLFFNSRLQQYECFRKLIQVYENEPQNVEKLMQLMQDVQE